jgi:glyoxylase-like metal-dependent hydrolase (beta-lactamase superfamily II)
MHRDAGRIPPFDSLPHSATITGSITGSAAGIEGTEMSLDTSLQHLHAIELPTPFPVGPVTVYVAGAPTDAVADAPAEKSGERLTLIDTGPQTDEARRALELALDHLGYSLSDLERIVITHAHADHFGLAADLVAASGAQVLTHPWNIPALGDYHADRDRRIAFYAGMLRQAAVPEEIMRAVGRATRSVDRYARPVAVDRTLDEGSTLRLAGRDWQVLHTPGHAAGLICLYEPASRTLLSSDHLLADISSNPVVEPPPPGHTERLRSLALYTRSLQRVAAMEIEQALPSHGPVIHDVAGLVRQRLAFHQRRMARVLDALRGGAHTTWDVTHALFPNLSPLDIFLAVSETIGHLDLLEMGGTIVGEEEDGVILWRLPPRHLDTG